MPHTSIKPTGAAIGATSSANHLEYMKMKTDNINMQTAEAVDVLSGEVTEQIDKMNARINNLNIGENSQENDIDKHIREICQREKEVIYP